MTDTLNEPAPAASEAEAAGMGPVPTIMLFFGVAVAALVALGLAGLVLWLVRPMGEAAEGAGLTTGCTTLAKSVPAASAVEAAPAEPTT